MRIKSSSMFNLEQIFADDFSKAALSQLLLKKIKPKNANITKEDCDLIAGKILNHKRKKDSFNVPLSIDGANLELSFNKKDLEYLNRSYGRLIDKIPAIIDEVIDNNYREVLNTLIRTWPEESKLQSEEIKGFEERLYKRWKHGLEGMRMILTMTRELGNVCHNDFKSKSDTPCLEEVLMRLHVRACQVADEIVCLIKSGYAHGALARWRTLHEISIVCLLMNQHGEELAQRYLDHSVIEEFKSAELYNKYCKQNKTLSIKKRQMDKIKQKHDNALLKYGKEFRHAQGWAAKHVCKDPSFANLQQAAQEAHKGSIYKLASHNVHANPLGIFARLGELEDRQFLLSGPSNAHLDEPAINTIQTLALITSSLIVKNPTFESLLSMRVIIEFSKNVIEKLVEARERLIRDELMMSIKRKSAKLSGAGYKI